MFIPVYRGEFGLKLRFHVPRVYAMGRDHEIEIEDGEEALYPLAKTWKRVPRDTPDAARVGRPRCEGLTRKEQRFVPCPYMLQLLQTPDVILCPRKRTYGASKNWSHWQWLSQVLTDAGLKVFSAGVADASDLTVVGDTAWQCMRPLDATIQAMTGRHPVTQARPLVVAACSGVAHLAVLCGSPLLMFTYGGRVAPGPVINSHGKFVRADYWPVRWEQYYANVNHTGAPLTRIDAWSDPEALRRAILHHHDATLLAHSAQ